MRTIFTCVLGIAGLAFVATGCVHEVHHHHHEDAVRKGGPPPWAPAHGHRRQHDGVDLVFDADLDVYVVVGRPGVYFRGDDYYCLRGGEWWAGSRWNGPWAAVVVSDLPPGLRKKYAKSHGKGRGKKHRDDDDD